MWILLLSSMGETTSNPFPQMFNWRTEDGHTLQCANGDLGGIDSNWPDHAVQQNVVDDEQYQQWRTHVDPHSRKVDAAWEPGLSRYVVDYVPDNHRMIVWWHPNLELLRLWYPCPFELTQWRVIGIHVSTLAYCCRFHRTVDVVLTLAFLRSRRQRSHYADFNCVCGAFIGSCKHHIHVLSSWFHVVTSRITRLKFISEIRFTINHLHVFIKVMCLPCVCSFGIIILLR